VAAWKHLMPLGWDQPFFKMTRIALEWRNFLFLIRIHMGHHHHARRYRLGLRPQLFYLLVYGSADVKFPDFGK
jgi:hypothetical protein